MTESMISVGKYDLNQQPLVSVVVVTYNSSKTIIETLESVKQQSYDRIELVLSDDCSSDETIALVNRWIGHNSTRFVHTEVVTTEKNTGVAGNLNRGINKSHGKWIKSIAGDDLLVPEAIEEYIEYVNSNKKIQMCVCDVEPFTEDGEKPQEVSNLYKRFFELAGESYEKQRRRVMTELVFIGPGYFYKRDLFNAVGGYTEKYGCAEEWPFVYKVIMGGNRIYTLDNKLILYRVSDNSLCHSKDSHQLPNKRVFEGMYMHFFDFAFKDLIKDGRPLVAWHHALLYWSEKIQYSIGNNLLRRSLFYCLMALSPLSWFHKLQRRENIN